MRKYLIGAAVAACALTFAVVAIAQITHGVPSAKLRAGSPATVLAGGWDQKVLATGAMPLENPSGIFTNYGYLNDAGASVPAGVTPQASGLKTKTEPDQNTYLTTTSNLGGPTAGYDYGRHYLIQGHEVFNSAAVGVGHSNAAYLTRINLDVPLYDPHRITLLSTPIDAENSGLASIDGSTYDPFSGQLLFTGEAGDSLSGDTQNPSAGQTSFGGVYATALKWTSTTPPAVIHAGAGGLQTAFGHGGYEGIQVDDKGSLMLLEDVSGPTVSSSVKKGMGYVYRFVPTDNSDLTKGNLQALQVTIDGTPLTYSSQDPIAGAPDKRLYTGETMSAHWVDVHDSTGAAPPSNFDANVEARAANATPFKRPENGRFVPGTGFRSYVFTVTGDTSSTAGNAQPDRGAWGEIFRIDMPSSGAATATVHAIVPGDGEHASYDSISFLDKDTILVGEDRGDGLHGSLNALDSTWAFDLTQPFDKTLSTAQRLIAQGRDPESTDDVAKKEASPPIADQNDGDNEVTGVLVANGISTVDSVFGTTDPAALSGTRIFYTGQHGANVTYEILPPGAQSGTTPPGTQGPAGPSGTNGTNGSNGTNGTNGTNGAGGPTGPQGLTGAGGPQGATGPGGTPGANGTNGTNGTNGADGAAGRDGKDGLTVLCKVSGRSVSCSFAKSTKAAKRTTSARLVRNGVTYAHGTLAKLARVHTVKKGRYTLILGSGKSARKLTVTVS